MKSWFLNANALPWYLLQMCAKEQAFQIDPRDRPVIDEVLSQLEEIAAARSVVLDSPMTRSQLESQHSLTDGKFSSSTSQRSGQLIGFGLVSLYHKHTHI